MNFLFHSKRCFGFNKISPNQNKNNYFDYVINVDDHTKQIFNASFDTSNDNNMRIIATNLCNDHPEHVLIFTFKNNLLTILYNFLNQYVTSRINSNSYHDCAGLARALKSNELVSPKLETLNWFTVNAMEFTDDINKNYNCDDLIVFYELKDNQPNFIHIIISLGLKHPHTNETLFISKNGQSTLQISTIRKLLKIYHQTNMIAKINIQENCDKSCVKSEDITMTEMIVKTKKNIFFPKSTFDIINSNTKKINNILKTSRVHHNCKPIFDSTELHKHTKEYKEYQEQQKQQKLCQIIDDYNPKFHFFK